jgi:sec-independent protein translocase protein TatB
MFDIGFWELVLVGVVALLVFGPERLPRVAREAGLWLRKARSIVASVKAEIDQELQMEEWRQSLLEQQKKLEREAAILNANKLARTLEADTEEVSPKKGTGERSHD